VKRQYIYIQQNNIIVTEKDIWHIVINAYDTNIRTNKCIHFTDEIIKIFPNISKKNVLYTIFTKPIDYKKPYLTQSLNSESEKIKITYYKLTSIIWIENLYFGPLKYIYLSDFINFNEKTVLFNGNLQLMRQSEINEIHFINCNFERIELYLNEIITEVSIIKLYNCIKFRSISVNLIKSIKEFYIDDIKIDIMN